MIYSQTIIVFVQLNIIAKYILIKQIITPSLNYPPYLLFHNFFILKDTKYQKNRKNLGLRSIRLFIDVINKFFMLLYEYLHQCTSISFHDYYSNRGGQIQQISNNYTQNQNFIENLWPDFIYKSNGWSINAFQAQAIQQFFQHMKANMDQFFLDEKDLPLYYQWVNKKQKNATQAIKNHEKIDLFIVLDISGSMNQTCNVVANSVNSGAGYAMFNALGTGIAATAGVLTGGIGGIVVGGAQKAIALAKSRLAEAKDHLIIQIKDLIKQNMINKLGLITFNHQAKVAYSLTQDFDKIFKAIQQQEASGQTALYDSLKFAASQLKNSKNPRMLIMTDGQDNASKSKDMQWAREWFLKEGLKSTFFTICQGHNQQNIAVAKKIQSEYINLGKQCWFSNRFSDESMVRGMRNLHIPNKQIFIQGGGAISSL